MADKPNFAFPGRAQLAPTRRPATVATPAARAPPVPRADLTLPAARVVQRLGAAGARAFLARVATGKPTPSATAARTTTQTSQPPLEAAASRGPSAGAHAGIQHGPVQPGVTAALPATAGARPGPAAALPATAAARPGATAALPANAAEHSAAAPAASKAAPPPPNLHAAMAPLAHALHARAHKASHHKLGQDATVGSAQRAAISPANEQARAAATGTVDHLNDAQTEQVQREEFKKKLRDAVDQEMHQAKTEDEANKVMNEGATRASATLRGGLQNEREAAVGGMRDAAKTDVPAGSVPAPKKSELQVEAVGAAPAPVDANPAVPPPLPPEKLDYSADRGPTDQVMADNNVSTDQLKEGNDPAFGPAINTRADAEKHEAAAEPAYRKEEAKIQSTAETRAQALVHSGLANIHGIRAGELGQVASQQHGVRAVDAAKRAQITAQITQIKDQTKSDVESILARMDTDAGAIFDAGLQRASDAYEAAFSDAKGGVGTWLTTWGSSWDRLIEEALGTAKRAYMSEVDRAIDAVANLIDASLHQAKVRVTRGRHDIDEVVSHLEGDMRTFGEQAKESVGADFDALDGQINDRRDALINRLSGQLKASFQKMNAREEELREANKSLWQRVYDATVGVIKKIIEFKNLLFSVLAKAASVITDIIAHPIRFLGNLVSAVGQGLHNFIEHLGTHLEKGLMDWLFGALGGAGLKLPDKFDLEGIVSIVLQVLGLTYANFRARAVAIVGEPVVAGLEKTAEVFKVFLSEGVGGIWRFIKEKVSDLKSMVLDAIFDYVKEKVITAGITWIIGLLNPASAFFKACKAIYDIIVFIVNRGSQILAFVNAVIDSVADIVSGNLSAAVTGVENALAKAIPVAIGFLAGLLGLGDPSKPVKQTIEKAQTPVNKAIDWVIHGAVKLVKAAGNAVKGLFGKRGKDDKTSETGDPQHDAKVAAGTAAIHEEEQKRLVDGELTWDGARAVAAKVKADHPVFKSITVHGEGGKWKYHYTASDGQVSGAPEPSFLLLKVGKVDERSSSNIGTFAPASEKVRTSVPGDKDAATGFEGQVLKDIESMLDAKREPAVQKNRFPAMTRTASKLPEETMILRQPKTNVSGGRVRDDKFGRPDVVVLAPRGATRVELVEVTLDASFQIPAGTPGSESHKRIQMATSVFGIAQKYPHVPIVYTIRSPRPPSPEACDAVVWNLRELHESGVNVQVIWRHG